MGLYKICTKCKKEIHHRKQAKRILDNTFWHEDCLDKQIVHDYLNKINSKQLKLDLKK